MTKNTKELLSDLNAIRAARGEKPLKSWKGSHVHLVELVAKAGGKVAAPPGGPNKVNGAHALQPPQADKPRKRTLDADEIHLTTIASELKLEPKQARMKARRHKAELAKLEVKGKKYVFPASLRDKVRAILERDARTE